MTYYAVKKGRNPGIYVEWEKCLEQVKGFSDSLYKSFTNINAAYLYLCGYKNLTRYKYSSRKALICNRDKKCCILIEQGNATFFNNTDNMYKEAIDEAIRRGVPALDLYLPDTYNKTDILKYIKSKSMMIKIDII